MNQEEIGGSRMESTKEQREAARQDLTKLHENIKQVQGLLEYLDALVKDVPLPPEMEAREQRFIEMMIADRELEKDVYEYLVQFENVDYLEDLPSWQIYFKDKMIDSLISKLRTQGK